MALAGDAEDMIVAIDDQMIDQHLRRCLVRLDMSVSYFRQVSATARRDCQGPNSTVSEYARSPIRGCCWPLKYFGARFAK